MKIAVAGTGAMAREALPVFIKTGWEVTAVSSTKRSFAAARELGERYSIRAFDDFGAMLRDGGADAVYIAVSNDVHFDFALAALEAGKHVILEKPFTTRARDAERLISLAEEKGLMLFEAISTLYSPNYMKILDWLPEIGRVRLISANFSQYSSRYDAFLAGRKAPVFDVSRSGGVLGDLHVYNIHYITGLFGLPESAAYLPNISEGVDTSGVLVMRYGGFTAVSMAAKDCGAPPGYIIEGEKGYISQDTSANVCGGVTLHLNGGEERHFEETFASRLEPEFTFFREAMEAGDLEASQRSHAATLGVVRLMEEVRLRAGIVFPTDE